MPEHQRANAAWNLTSLAFLALALGHGFLCLGVLRMLVPIVSSGDNTYFMPLSFMYLEKGELANPWLNPVGTTIFNWHGFIHPLVVAAISVGEGWQGVNFGILALGVAAFLLFVILGLYFRVAPIFLLLATVIVISMIVSYSGRPETTVATLCMLLFAAVVAGLTLEDLRSQFAAWLLAGVLTGILAAANPNAVPAVVLGQICAMSAIYGIKQDDVPRLCVSLLVIFGTAFASLLLLLFFVYPFSAADWIDGLAAHRQKIVDRDLFGNAELSNYVKDLLVSKDAPLLLLYSLLIIPIAASLYGLISRAKNRLVAYGTLAVFCALLFFLLRGLVTPHARYNFTVYVPTILLIVGVLMREGRLVSLKTGTVSLLCVLAAAALATQFIWIDQNIRSLSNAAHYKSRLNTLLSHALDSGSRVAINGALLTAIEDPDLLKKVHVILADGEADATRFDMVILSQNEHPLKRPVALRNFVITEVEYDQCCSLFFPRPLNSAFAVYQYQPDVKRAEARPGSAQQTPAETGIAAAKDRH